MLSNKALIVFIKNPVLGKAKTRIAKSSDDATALSIYKKLLEETRRTTVLVDAKKYLYYSDFIDNGDAWNPTVYKKMLQRGVDLGERMMDAFIEVLSYHDKAIIIGSDCIYLTKEIIEEAYEALDHNDVVLGPAKDGGYYLLGMKRTQMDLFLNIPWSSGREFKETLTKVKAKGLSYQLLETLNDIDHIEDWEEYLLS